MTLLASSGWRLSIREHWEGATRGIGILVAFLSLASVSASAHQPLAQSAYRKIRLGEFGTRRGHEPA